MAAISDEEPGTERGDAYQVELKKADDVTVSFHIMAKVEVEFERVNLTADGKDYTVAIATATDSKGNPVIGAEVRWESEVKGLNGQVIKNMQHMIDTQDVKTDFQGQARIMYRVDQPVSVKSTAIVTGLGTITKGQGTTKKLAIFRRYAVTKVEQSEADESGDSFIVTAVVTSIKNTIAKAPIYKHRVASKKVIVKNVRGNPHVQFINSNRTDKAGRVQFLVKKKNRDDVMLLIQVNKGVGAVETPFSVMLNFK